MARNNKYKNIYNKYSDELYQMIFFITKSNKETEEILVAVFEDVFADINMFLNIEKKVEWLTKKTKQKIIEVLRREKKYFYFNEYNQEKHMNVINMKDITENQFETIMMQIKIEERYVIYSLFYQGMNIRECAEELMVEEYVIKRMINKLQNKIDIERGKYK